MADSRALGLIFATLEGILETLSTMGAPGSHPLSLPMGLDTSMGTVYCTYNIGEARGEVI